MNKSILILIILGIGGYLGYYLTKPTCSDDILSWLPETWPFLNDTNPDRCSTKYTITADGLIVSANATSAKEYFQAVIPVATAQGWRSRKMTQNEFEFACSRKCGSTNGPKTLKIVYNTKTDEIKFVGLKLK